jgi:hypothetical protein
MAKSAAVCGWPSLSEALGTFVAAAEGTQGAAHIRALHHYVACRLVIEGGFHPSSIAPRPPFVVEHLVRERRLLLRHDPESGGSGERTVLGGLRTKDVDVLVEKEGIGPCLAVSLKGMVNAFRNLTNRVEDAVGDCTNLHITYPALVFGLLFVLRANREGPLVAPVPKDIKPDEHGNTRSPDVSVTAAGEPTDQVLRFHDTMRRLANRQDLRNDATRYEAVAVALVNPDPVGISSTFPPAESPVQFDGFFRRLYDAYDQRYVYAAPTLARVTARMEWDPASPVLADDCCKAEYEPRIAAE